MKTTIDIPERELREVMRHTGAATKREAVVTAIEEQGSKSSLAKISATGRLLSTADFLGKIQVLSEHQITPVDATRGLSEQARACLEALAKSARAEAAANDQSIA